MGFTNDSGWGCTIRVSQMLLCHSIIRNELGNYDLMTLGDSKIYLKMLQLINDNTDDEYSSNNSSESIKKDIQ